MRYTVWTSQKVEVRDEVKAPSARQAAKMAMELTEDLGERLSRSGLEVQWTDMDCGHGNEREFLVYDRAGECIPYHESPDGKLSRGYLQNFVAE